MTDKSKSGIRSHQRTSGWIGLRTVVGTYVVLLEVDM